MLNSVFEARNLLTILTSILFVIFLVLKHRNSQKRFHPGPIGIPLVGYLPFVEKHKHLKLTELKKQYGDVFSFRLGWMHFVVLGSFDVIKEAMTKYNEFAARPLNFLMMPNLANYPGIIMNDGNSLLEIRRFTLSVLRNFGFGTSSMEQKIHDEISIVLQHLSKVEDEAICIEDTLRMSTINTVCAIVFGHRFDYDNEAFKRLMKMARHYAHEISVFQIKSFIPRFLLDILSIKDAGYYGNQIYDTLLEIIEQQANSNLSGTTDSFIDIWLEEQKKANVDPKNFNKRQLAKVVWDLFLAASDTMATTIHWILLYLAHHQEVQTKVQKEIDDIIGRHRTPNMIDQKQMPFTEAVTLEASRIAPTVLFLIPRRALADVEFHGYIIPKDATILSNIWSINHDSNIYPQPEEFKPERFLNADNKIMKRDELMPFGIGKRQCIGESIARVSVFLYMTSFLQNFSVKPEGTSCIDLVPKVSFVLHPKPQKICIIPRHLCQQ